MHSLLILQRIPTRLLDLIITEIPHAIDCMISGNLNCGWLLPLRQHIRQDSSFMGANCQKSDLGKHPNYYYFLANKAIIIKSKKKKNLTSSSPPPNFSTQI